MMNYDNIEVFLFNNQYTSIVITRYISQEN